MRLFKRISSTVLSSVERVVSEVENHDAVVEAMLRDLQRASAETQLRLKRVRKDGDAMRSQLDQLKQDETNWTTRAKASAATDEQTALECLSRRQCCQDETTRLTKVLMEHSETEKQLQTQVKNIEKRHKEISQQRHLLKTRESVAEANRVIVAVTGGTNGDIDDTMDRWELSIAKREGVAAMSESAVSHVDEPIDHMEQRFINEEKQAQLKQQLHSLLNETTKAGEQND